ncbi:MAG: hypothetical protein SVO01_11045 [Thermotogota bacterium]|nr:hypothetical protein [Thermotogota bacterium]
MKKVLIEPLKKWFLNIEYNLFKGIAYIFTFFLTLVGIAQAFEWILNTEHPVFVGVVFFLSIILLLIFYLHRPRALKLYSIKRNEGIIILNQEHILEIYTNGRSKFTKKRTSLLRKDPSKEDFKDYIHSSGKEDFDKVKYHSHDSRVVDVNRESDDSISIFFLPNNDVKKLEPWYHEFVWFPSHIFGGRYDCIRLPVVCEIGVHKTIVRTALPIEKVICFWEPPWLNVKNYDKLGIYALNAYSINAPPADNVSESGFEWEIESPKVGSVYNCMFFYKNGASRLLQDYSRWIWVTKLKVFYHTFLRT